MNSTFWIFAKTINSQNLTFFIFHVFTFSAWTTEFLHAYYDTNNGHLDNFDKIFHKTIFLTEFFNVGGRCPMFLTEWQQVILGCRVRPVSRVIFDGKHVIFTSNCQNLGLHLKNIPSERPPTVWENISFAYFSFSLVCRLMYETNRQKRKENDDSFLNQAWFVAPL